MDTRKLGVGITCGGCLVIVLLPVIVFVVAWFLSAIGAGG